jgi:hypothetical protein
MATSVFGSIGTPSLGMGEAGKTIDPTKLGRIQAWLKTPGGKAGVGMLGLFLLQSMLRSKSEEEAGVRSAEMQGESMQRMGQALSSGDSAYYDAMLPVSQAEQTSARSALMSKLLGVTGPSLARGEQFIGG